VENFLAGKGPRARALFRRFTELIAACGPYEIAPAKTRVAFMVRTRFASVNRVSETGMSAHFGLPYALRSNRIDRIENLAGWYVHYFRVAEPRELDEEIQGWLRESYAQMGEQKRLLASED
jgi:hypothetical protein